MAGVPLPTVQQILGHRNIQTTLCYAHLSPSHTQAEIEKGSFANLGIGTGSKTGSAFESAAGRKSEAIDLMARPAGIKPATFSLEDRCSYQTDDKYEEFDFTVSQ